jgi:hypothetical protein
MLARCLIMLWLMLSPVAAALAQMPPAPPSDQPPLGAAAGGQLAAPSPPAADQRPARVFCDQNVAFQLDDPASTPDSYRRFIGVWSDAAWDTRTCAALIVQHVGPDGNASIVYIYGPEGSRSPIVGAVLRGTGVIKDGELRFQNSDGSQYAFRPREADGVVVDMVGHWINPKGESFQATFKPTP